MRLLHVVELAHAIHHHVFLALWRISVGLVLTVSLNLLREHRVQMSHLRRKAELNKSFSGRRRRHWHRMRKFHRRIQFQQHFFVSHQNSIPSSCACHLISIFIHLMPFILVFPLCSLLVVVWPESSFFYPLSSHLSPSLMFAHSIIHLAEFVQLLPNALRQGSAKTLRGILFSEKMCTAKNREIKLNGYKISIFIRF